MITQLLDGGMGQELIKRCGKSAHPLWSAKLLIDQPQMIQAVHAEYIAAGATVITVSNYTCTPQRLAQHNLEDQLEKLHRTAIDVALRARDQASHGQKVLIAGCLPPLVASYHPKTLPSRQVCLDSYRLLCELQADHVDILLCETLSASKSLTTASTAALEFGLPVWVSGTVDDQNGELLRSGESLSSVLEDLDPAIDALLLNCSTPEAITSAGLPILKTQNKTFGAYANGFVSIDALTPGSTVDQLSQRHELDEPIYLDYVKQWVAMGAEIVGGCCEIGPSHIAAIAHWAQQNAAN